MTGKYNLYQKAMITLQNKMFEVCLRSVNTKNDLKEFIQEIKFFKKYDEQLADMLRNFPDEAKFTPMEKELTEYDKLDPSTRLRLKKNFIKNLPSAFQIQKVDYEERVCKEFANLLSRELSPLPLPEYPGDPATYCLMSDTKFNKAKFISLITQWGDAEFTAFCNACMGIQEAHAWNYGPWATDRPIFKIINVEENLENFWCLRYSGFQQDICDLYKTWTDDNRPEFQIQLIRFQKHIFQYELDILETTKYLLALSDLFLNRLYGWHQPEHAFKLRTKYTPGINNDISVTKWLIRDPQKLSHWEKIADDYRKFEVKKRDLKQDTSAQQATLEHHGENEDNFQDNDEGQSSFQTSSPEQGTVTASGIHLYDKLSPKNPADYAQESICENSFVKEKFIELISQLSENDFEIYCDSLRSLQMFFDMNTACWGTEHAGDLPELVNEYWLFEYLG